MMSSWRRYVAHVGRFCSEIVLSASGCLLFVDGFQFVARDEERSVPGLPLRAVESTRKQWAGMDAAVFLMAFVVSEILMLVAVFRG